MLNIEFPIHAKLSRMIAKDGLTFNVFKKSADLRESLQAWIQIHKIEGRLPQSDSSIKSYVMDYGLKLKELVKSVRENCTYLHILLFVLIFTQGNIIIDYLVN